ncbi:hypothetical protein BTO05_08015 [Winogradskyella sp. PC-19]|uniref:hypothetical protein n=1 Tax=unclassified Winogradskyella TaxID=2615021 RepID=UPI000B3C7A06|nr:MULTISPECIES: hypothetical protein [unclassified Winogradskyella]ARV09586.1 hypothetical protein BTO05_08015 [Winogradskyella sp. PC-19]RZN83441.1 MAG: hypothetical protein EVB12_01660 [Winogradskyella sp.]
MKQLFFTSIFLFSFVINLQNQSIDKEIRTQVNEISIKDSFTFDDYVIRFVNVLSDSRCPKGVMCVQAGAAIVKVVVYKSGKPIQNHNMTFTPNGYFPNNKGNLFNSETLKITSIGLLPYPKPETQIIKENYTLKLLIEEEVE